MGETNTSEAILAQVRTAVKAADAWDWTSLQFRTDLIRILRTRVPRPRAPTAADVDRLAEGMFNAIDAETGAVYADADPERQASLRYFAGLALRVLHSEQ